MTGSHYFFKPVLDKGSQHSSSFLNCKNLKSIYKVKCVKIEGTNEFINLNVENMNKNNNTHSRQRYSCKHHNAKSKRKDHHKAKRLEFVKREYLD